MNETITRTLSGIVYVILLLIATSYSEHSFFLLFGFFMIITIYEFCQLIQLNKRNKASFELIFSIETWQKRNQFPINQ